MADTFKVLGLSQQPQVNPDNTLRSVVRIDIETLLGATFPVMIPKQIYDTLSKEELVEMIQIEVDKANDILSL